MEGHYCKKIVKDDSNCCFISCSAFSLQGMSAVRHTAPDPLGVYDSEFCTTLTESIETCNNILDGLNSEVYSVSSENGGNNDGCYGGAYIDE